MSPCVWMKLSSGMKNGLLGACSVVFVKGSLPEFAKGSLPMNSNLLLWNLAPEEKGSSSEERAGKATKVRAAIPDLVGTPRACWTCSATNLSCFLNWMAMFLKWKKESLCCFLWKNEEHLMMSFDCWWEVNPTNSSKDEEDSERRGNGQGQENHHRTKERLP